MAYKRKIIKIMKKNSRDFLRKTDGVSDVVRRRPSKTSWKEVKCRCGRRRPGTNKETKHPRSNAAESLSIFYVHYRADGPEKNKIDSKLFHS